VHITRNNRKTGLLHRFPLSRALFCLVLVLTVMLALFHYRDLWPGAAFFSGVNGDWAASERLVFVVFVIITGCLGSVRAGGVMLLAVGALMLGRLAFGAVSFGPVLLEIIVLVCLATLSLRLIARWRRDRADCTRLRGTLNRSRLSEENFRELFQNASDAIWIHDLDGRVIAANRADEEMVGYALEELLGRDVREFLTDDARQVAAQVRQKLLQGEPVEPRYEQQLRRKDGSEALIEVTTRLIKKGGRPIAFQNIARDISRKRQMQDNLHFALQKVLVAQEEERKRIARELHDGTAQSILLLIHRLDAAVTNLNDKLTDTERQVLEELLSLTRRTLTDIRRFSQELRPAILDDLGLMAALEWLADRMSAEDKIRVDVASERSLPELSHQEQLVLFRVAQEALTNVRRHARANRVFVRLWSVSGRVHMLVEDDGRGFQPPSTDDNLDGSKLGLIGMRERIQLLGGSLDIKSEIGKGTVVTASLPITV
jgi:PAS domain S-box-containing protein